MIETPLFRIPETREEILIMTLPPFLKEDLERFSSADHDDPLVDCMVEELKASINAAYWGYEITAEQANYVAEEYLGLEMGYTDERHQF